MFLVVCMSISLLQAEGTARRVALEVKESVRRQERTRLEQFTRLQTAVEGHLVRQDRDM